eukprot:31519-Pelagomonas_calceolata.AAC.6
MAHERREGCEALQESWALRRKGDATAAGTAQLKITAMRNDSWWSLCGCGGRCASLRVWMPACKWLSEPAIL